MSFFGRCACLFLPALFFIGQLNAQFYKNDRRPNIVLIVADDLGYSDLGCFGSEIQTPNIDALAKSGHIFTDFHTAPTCSPTRAMLLTGVDHHIAGMGNMAEFVPRTTNQSGKPGYEGYLNEKVVSIAQLLQDTGYHTYIAGKWHLGLTPEHSPKAAGFDRSYTLMDGGTSHYYPDSIARFWNDEDYTTFPSGQYSTDFYTERMMEFLESKRWDGRPFFLFAAYTSPHWPLQAPEAFLRRTSGRYNQGYEQLRLQRFEALQAKGIIPKAAQLPPLPAFKGNTRLAYPATDSLVRWASLDAEQQAYEARKMEVYAAMVENLDYHIGRLVAYLKESGKYDNTLFVFFSDNGADPMEFNRPQNDNSYYNLGHPDSYFGYGSPWAHACTAAFPLYKGYATEGGIRTPLIVKLPNAEGQGLMHHGFASVLDMFPTFLEVAGLKYPKTYQDRELAPLQGTSLLPYLQGKSKVVHNDKYVMGWELFGRYALRQGDWKITWVEQPIGSGRFELFNLAKDPTESRDLAAQNPAKLKEMIKLWDNYRTQTGVVLPEWKPEYLKR